jgi:hypothetical protein
MLQLHIMRKFLVAALVVAMPSFALAQDAPVRNIAGDFASTWEASKNMPMAERVAAFKKNVASQYPEFYAASRFGGEEKQDARIARAIEKFGTIRDAYLDKVKQFGDAMPLHIATFRAVFSDFRLSMPTWLVHSLHEMDGGTRDFNGRTDLIFGADMMATLHADDDLTPLFHHELFHVYHEPRFSCGTEAVWKNLWEEGLAVYVSQALNPKATPAEMLLNFPHGMPDATEAQLPAAWAQLERELDNTDPALYAELFSTAQSKSTLPARRGYYLGYLLAKEAGKSSDVTTLAHLNCDQVHTLVKNIVHRKRLETQVAAAR